MNLPRAVTIETERRDVFERAVVVGLLLSVLAAGFVYARLASAGPPVDHGYGYGYGYGYGFDGVITGQKWNDLDGDGVWQEHEPTIPGWPIQVHRLQQDETLGWIPTELIGLSLTGGDGSFTIPVPGPGRYRVSEPDQDGWRNTHPADSFFDVFVSLEGGEVSQDLGDNPLNFGNTETPPVISGESAGQSKINGFTITWITDSPATSRVIYDTISHPVLGDAPNYGYANSTVESDTDPKVTNHSVTLTGLTQNTNYYYRTVSTGSPEAVSSEHSFGTSLAESSSGGGGGGSAGDVILPPAGQVAGAAIAGCYPYNRNLTVGMTGDDVAALQDFLVGQNAGPGARALANVLASGVPKGHFGSLTKAALAEYQAVKGISPPAGYFGPITRAHVASLCGGEVQGATATQLQALQTQLLSLLQQYLNLLQQKLGK